MTEDNSREVERALLFISDAQERARRASQRIEKDGTDPDTAAALGKAQEELGEVHRRLMQGTYYAIPPAAQQLAI